MAVTNAQLFDQLKRNELILLTLISAFVESADVLKLDPNFVAVDLAELF